ncbi:GHKL domain-containing protein [Chitinophaga filiformis]|uniref:GHKL domain-containing protein n=1 Tax=Chitinophaga filiformis TaxID=104663 RepID=A0A1G7RUV4_CHIFI|nr:GHKL domain-containing protein [Chitinophaga filiformis]
MERSNEFSIYPNESAKRLLHILYWVMMLFFIMAITSYSFKASVFNTKSALFSTGVLFNTILIHYFVCYFGFQHIRKRRWVLMILDILAIYLVSLLITTSSLNLLKYLFPEDAVITRLYQNFAVNSFRKAFNGELLLWILSLIIWFNTFGIIIKIGKDFHESSLEKLAIAQEKNSMEISFLRAQIQPHFLFNTLNSIYGLIIHNEEASKVVIQLSNLLRFSLYDSAKEHITLKEEIEFLTNYLLLEKMRYKESRVQIEYDFEQVENKEKIIKPLILINFIENAFKHGINATIRSAWIKLSMTEKDGILTFHSANNKPVAATGKRNNESTGGLGLKNVRRRLELEYQTRYSLDIKETDDVYEVALILKL